MKTSLSKALGAVLLAAPLWVYAQHHETGPAHPKSAKPAIAVGAAFDTQGRLWLARVDKQHLFVSHSDDSGLHFSAPVQVTSAPETIAADGENRPKIAVGADGTVMLSWTQTLPQNYTGNIRFARSVDGGKTFGAPVTLNDDGRVTSHRFDALAIDGKGRVAVAWLDARDRDASQNKGDARNRNASKRKSGAYAGVSVYTAQSSDNGAHFSANRRLAEHTCECCRVASTWSNDGPVVFWRNLYGVNTRDFAFARLDDGNVRRASDDNWRIDACPHHGGGIAADGKGALHLVWFTNGKTRQGLFYKRIAGAVESSPMAFGNAAAQAGHPGVAAMGDRVILTWREFNGSVYVAYALSSDDGGANWRAPIRLAEAAGVADYPLPLIDGTRAWVVWNTAAEGLRVLPIESGSGK
ncbi:MAG: sialidase family protein [Thiobacillus sp.]|nr:sialidase family protein [Thiobacillus sp.]